MKLTDALAKLRCGGCGCDTVRVFTNGERVFTECTQCDSVTELSVSKPKISFEWPKGAEGKGILCDFKDGPAPDSSGNCCAGGPQWGHAWNCPKLP